MKEQPFGWKRVKVTLEQAMKAQKGSRLQLYSFFNLGGKRGGWSTPCPGHFTLGKTWSPLHKRLGWPQG